MVHSRAMMTQHWLAQTNIQTKPKYFQKLAAELKKYLAEFSTD